MRDDAITYGDSSDVIPTPDNAPLTVKLFSDRFVEVVIIGWYTVARPDDCAYPDNKVVTLAVVAYVERSIDKVLEVRLKGRVAVI